MKIFRKRLKYLAAASAVALFLNGCGDSENFVFTNTNNNVVVNNAPVAQDDTVLALGNATLSQATANGVLVNDTLNGGEIVAFDSTTTNGGTVDLNDDGSFTYTPAFGFTGTDSFEYTLGNSEGTSTATVTLNVNNQGWFVNNEAASNGNGAQDNPFDNLQDALDAADSGDTVFVFRGDGTTANLGSTINLPAGVDLIGQGNGLTLGQQIEPAGDRPTLQGPIICGGDNTVAGFTIEGSGTNGVEAASVNDVNVLNNVFNATMENNVEFVDVGGTCTISNNTFNNNTTAADLVDLDGTDITASYTIAGNTFTTDVTNSPDRAIDVFFDGDSDVSLTVNENDITSANLTDTFQVGLEVNADDTSSITVAITGNTFTRTGFTTILLDPIELGSSISGTVSQNTIDQSGNNGIDLDADGTLSLTISQNMISNSNNNGISLATDATDSLASVTIENNQVTDSGNTGIYIESQLSDSVVRAAVRNNTITDSATSALSAVDNGGGVCLDFTGNTVNDDVILDNDGGGLEVEQLDAPQGGPLTDLNTFTPPAAIQEIDSPTSVADGTCVTP